MSDEFVNFSSNFSNSGKQKARKFTSEKPRRPTSGEDTNNLPKQLQVASELGLQLATILAKFEKDLEHWRASIDGLLATETQDNKNSRLSSAVIHSHSVEWNCSPSCGPAHTTSGDISKSPSNVKYPLKRGKNSSAKKLPAPPTSRTREGIFNSSTTPLCLIDRSADCHPQLWALWTEAGQHAKKLPSAMVVRGDTMQKKPSEKIMLPLACLDRFVIDPMSIWRHVLDVFCIAMVVFDLITLPLSVFNYDETEFAEHMRIITIVYWTFDMFSSFFGGYQLLDGEVETRFWKCFKRCLWTKTPFDALIVSLDWVLYAIDSTKALASVARLSKTARLVRIMRLVRLARSAKMLEMVERMKTWPISSQVLSFLNVARLIFNLMIINHFLGCGWYAVGTMNPHQETWVVRYLNRPENVDDSMFLRYLISYHWSIAQFTPCPSHIHPVNLPERLYTVIIIVFGLVLFASLFGNVTAIINASRKSAYEQMMAHHNLKEYLFTNKVSMSLSSRIQKFVRMNRIRKTRVLESDVHFLTTLNKTLMQELHFQVHGPVLQWHPLLNFIKGSHHDTFVSLCHTSCNITTLAVGDEIFHYRATFEFMIMQLSGILEYKTIADVSSLSKTHIDMTSHENTVFIKKGAWVCEPPLWIAWENRGLLTVGEQSDILMVNSHSFREAASHHRSSLSVLKRYAHQFANKLAQDAKLRAIDDLWGDRKSVV